MANPRQRRKARSGSTMKPSLNAKRQMKKKLARAPTVHGADILKDSYDPKLTLRQNYAKLGLIPSLDVRPDTGGVEPTSTSTTTTTTTNSTAEAPVRKGMARIIRDDDGNIIDIIEPSTEDEVTPWGKPLPSSIADSDDVDTLMPAKKQTETQVLARLQTLADRAAPIERHTSTQEAQWLSDLVVKHGEDVEAMAKDLKLNVWQKTQGEIKRAIRKAGGFEAFK